MKTADLEGAALEWWFMRAIGDGTIDSSWTCSDYVAYGGLADHLFGWGKIGPIIERERIQLSLEGDEWCAEAWDEDAHIKLMPGQIKEYGPTPLIAAMRCVVLSKFGEDVQV